MKRTMLYIKRVRSKPVIHVLREIVISVVILMMLMHKFVCVAEETNICYFFIGGSIETDSGAASEDIKEILRASVPNTVHIFLCVGGAERWQMLPWMNHNSAWLEVKNGEIVPIGICPYQQITTSDAVEKYLRMCNEISPSDRTFLIFWGHGTDAPSGIGFDENNGDVLELKEICKGISDANIRIDIIGLDACSMATEENAVLLSDSAEYLVASEENEDLAGWQHTEWLNRLPADNVTQAAVYMADSLNRQLERRGIEPCAKIIELEKYRRN